MSNYPTANVDDDIISSLIVDDNDFFSSPENDFLFDSVNDINDPLGGVHSGDIMPGAVMPLGGGLERGISCLYENNGNSSSSSSSSSSNVNTNSNNNNNMVKVKQEERFNNTSPSTPEQLEEENDEDDTFEWLASLPLETSTKTKTNKKTKEKKPPKQPKTSSSQSTATSNSSNADNVPMQAPVTSGSGTIPKGGLLEGLYNRILSTAGYTNTTSNFMSANGGTYESSDSEDGGEDNKVLPPSIVIDTIDGNTITLPSLSNSETKNNREVRMEVLRRKQITSVAERFVSNGKKGATSSTTKNLTVANGEEEKNIRKVSNIEEGNMNNISNYQTKGGRSKSLSPKPNSTASTSGNVSPVPPSSSSAIPTIKQEEDEDAQNFTPAEKRQRRLIRNRIAAQEHRERKRLEVTTLENLVAVRDEKIKQLEHQLLLVKNVYGSHVIDGIIAGGESSNTNTANPVPSNSSLNAINTCNMRVSLPPDLKEVSDSSDGNISSSSSSGGNSPSHSNESDSDDNMVGVEQASSKTTTTTTTTTKASNKRRRNDTNGYTTSRNSVFAVATLAVVAIFNVLGNQNQNSGNITANLVNNNGINNPLVKVLPKYEVVNSESLIVGSSTPSVVSVVKQKSKLSPIHEDTVPNESNALVPANRRLTDIPILSINNEEDFMIHPIENYPELWDVGRGRTPWTSEKSEFFYDGTGLGKQVISFNGSEGDNLRDTNINNLDRKSSLRGGKTIIKQTATSNSKTFNSAASSSIPSFMFAPEAKAVFSDPLLFRSLSEQSMKGASGAAGGGSKALINTPSNALTLANSNRIPRPHILGNNKASDSNGGVDNEDPLLVILMKSKSLFGGVKRNGEWEFNNETEDRDGGVDGDTMDEENGGNEHNGGGGGESDQAEEDVWVELSCKVLQARVLEGLDFMTD